MQGGKGMFDIFDKNKSKNLNVYAPVNGCVINLTEVKDQVFASGAVGKGFGMEPTANEVLSPVEGKIVMIASTKHAFGITTKQGYEILLHLGIDTVELNGEPFSIYVNVGQKVKPGTKLANMDITKIKKANLEPTVITLVTNAEEKAVDFEVNAAEKNLLAGKIVGNIKANKE